MPTKEQVYEEMCKRKWEETELKITLFELIPDKETSKATSFFSRLAGANKGQYVIEIEYDGNVDTRYAFLADKELCVSSSNTFNEQEMKTWERVNSRQLTIDNMRDGQFDDIKIQYELAQSIIATAKVMAFAYIASTDRYTSLVNIGIKRQIAELITFMDKMSAEPFYKMKPTQFMAIDINDYDAVELRSSELVNKLKASALI